MVGRLWEQKDPGCLVRSLLPTLARGSGADLILVGDGDLRQQLQQRVDAAGLQAHVHFLGWRTDTPDLLRASDIFVLPSRWGRHAAGHSGALMGTGLPVVVSDIPGNRHLVEHKQQGLLFAMGDSAALADALSKLIVNPDLRASLGKNARQKVEEQHDIRGRGKTS